MPDERNRNIVGPLFLRTQSDEILAPENVAEKIENFEITATGTLRSVEGPIPFVPAIPPGPAGNSTTTSPTYPNYGTMHGIFHAKLDGGARDVLLVHSGSELLEFNGKAAGTLDTWTTLVSTSSGLLNRTLQDDSSPQFPCQFESTPRGIIIVPQGGSEALMYDGDILLPLGYSAVPAAPQGFGPDTTTGNVAATPNTGGYNADYYKMNQSDQTVSAAGDRTDAFGDGRLGTLQTTPGMATPSDTDSPNAGNLLSGSYRCAVQWINHFGDVSAQSSRSNPVTWNTQHSDIDPTTSGGPEVAARLETVLRQVVWASIPPGPDGTKGRILSRTLDERNAETTDLFVLTGDYAGSTTGAFATIPDNQVTVFPDNTADGLLFNNPREVLPMPKFRLCRVAMGRLWVANTRSDPGILIPSYPGMWGTLQKDAEIFPDASGDEITGLWRTSGGLLVFTAQSTYYIEPGYSGDQPFRSSTLHPSIGCVAPSSIAEMPNGMIVWLGRDGFYAYDGEKFAKISDAIKETTARIIKGRAKQATAAVDYDKGEYRCWVAVDDSVVNNLCFVFDGNGWRQRTDANFAGVCTTRDHRRYMIGCGRITDDVGTARDGVWLLDHAVKSFSSQSRESRIETVWLAGTRSESRKSAMTVKLWLRETHTTGTLTVDVYRDWRKDSPEQTLTFELDSPEDKPPAWDTTLLGSEEAYWVRRRPFWSRKDISIPSCETYKLIIRSSNPIEFVGMSIDESPRPNAMRMPRG